MEPGTWFGDISLFDGLPHTHDATTHGPTTLLIVRKHDFNDLLSRHSELYEALLRLNCRRLRLMFAHFEDLNTKPLAARLAKQVLILARSYGVTNGEEIRIGLQLAQEDLAQLVGASRQRVNQELKGFEREGALRIEPTRLVVLSRDKLAAIVDPATLFPFATLGHDGGAVELTVLQPPRRSSLGRRHASPVVELEHHWE